MDLKRRARELMRQRDREQGEEQGEAVVPWWEREQRKMKVRLLVDISRLNAKRGQTVELDEWQAGELILQRKATDKLDGDLPPIPQLIPPRPPLGEGWYA